MAEAKKTKRGEIKIVEPLSKFSGEMKANIEKMLKMAHKTIDKRLTGLEKYFEKAKRDNPTAKKQAKKTTQSLNPSKAAKKVKAKASTVAKKVKAKTSKVAKSVKAKTSKVAKSVKAKVRNTPKKAANSSKKRATQKK
jgi:hypothetical protein